MVALLVLINASVALPVQPAQTEPAGGGAIELLPKTAKLKGKLKLDSSGAVKGWNNKAMSLEWSFTCKAAGSYRVEVLQSTSPSAQGNSTYHVVVADQTLDAAPKPTKGWDDYEVSDVGVVQLAAGPVKLAIRPVELHGTLMSLKSVTLTPASDRPVGANPATGTDAAAQSKTVIELGGEADEACAGGAGRYLIFHPKNAQQLVVVDVVAGKLLNPIPTPGEFRFAAGRDKLLLVLNGQHILQRWDLKTQTREQTALIEGDEPVKIAAMGEAGGGPLALWSGKKVELYDVRTLKPLKVSGSELEFSGHVHLVPSADGLTFAAFGWTTGPIQLLRLSNLTATSAVCTQSESKAWITYNAAWGIPGPEGSLLVAHDAEPNVFVMGTAEQDTRAFKGAALYPTEDPRFLALLRPVEKKKSGSLVSLVAANDLRVLCTVPDVEPVTGGTISTFKGRLGFLPRVNYLPAEKRLIVIPDSNDRVVVRPFDLDQALKSTAADYLFVISRPTTRLKPGEQLSYQVEALSKSGSLRYKLEQGPPGMAISPGGLLTWQAAASQKDAKIGVILAVSDSSGQEVNQAFEIELVVPVTTVVANTPPPATVPKPQPPHRTQQDTMPKPPARSAAAKPVNPADPDLSAYAALLASRVQAAQQRGAMMDPETIGSVNVSALSAERTPDGARIVLASHQDIPKDQDFRSIRSTIEVKLTPLPGGKWACAEARARVDSVSSSHGPVTDEPSRWQIITRDMQKIVDSISSTN